MTQDVGPVRPATAAAPMDEDAKWRSLLDRLNELSVTRHFDAYTDVDWDNPLFALDPGDPRWELSGHDPLGSMAWCQGLPQPDRARLGSARLRDGHQQR